MQCKQLPLNFFMPAPQLTILLRVPRSPGNYHYRVTGSDIDDPVSMQVARQHLYCRIHDNERKHLLDDQTTGQSTDRLESSEEQNMLDIVTKTLSLIFGLGINNLHRTAAYF